MAIGYTDIPDNMAEITPYVIIEKDAIVATVFQNLKCYFYDTCSFRRHANLNNNEVEYLLKYIKSQGGIVIITRCILMELASHRGVLNQKYVDYIRRIKDSGILILVMYEEDLFSVMEVCYNANSVINGYLHWAVRAVKSPVGTIAETLKRDSSIQNEVIKGKNADYQGVYKRFFEAVRGNKESGDNLGEELLAICMHVLSHMPGEEDGKFCVLTDDKGAAGKFATLFNNKTLRQHRGKKIAVFSTPRLVQVLYRENILVNKEQIKTMLSTGTHGNIVVLGTLLYDIRNNEISKSSDELAELVMQPNGINIIF